MERKGNVRVYVRLELELEWRNETRCVDQEVKSGVMGVIYAKRLGRGGSVTERVASDG